MRRSTSKYGLNVRRCGQDFDERDAVLDPRTHNSTRTRTRIRNRDWDGNWFRYVDAWDFSFFSTKLLKHYETLKLHVFDELAYRIGDLVVLTKIAPINLIVMKRLRL